MNSTRAKTALVNCVRDNVIAAAEENGAAVPISLSFPPRVSAPAAFVIVSVPPEIKLSRIVSL